jgi:succinate dehydrogenase flavoprotein subunit
MTDYLLDDLGDLRTNGSAVDGVVPGGDPATAWDRRKASYRPVSPLGVAP